MKIHVHIKTYTHVGIESSTFVLAKTRKQHRHPPAYRCTNKCGPSTRGSITQPWKGVKPWHALARGWTLRTQCSVRDADAEGRTGCDSTDGKRAEQADPLTDRVGSWWSGAGERRMERDCWWRQDVFWGWKNVLECEHFSEFYNMWTIHHQAEHALHLYPGDIFYTFVPLTIYLLLFSHKVVSDSFWHPGL